MRSLSETFCGPAARRWLRSVSMALLCGVWLFAVTAPAGAEVVNPSFEDGLTGWTLQGSNITLPLVEPFPAPPPPPPALSGAAGNATTAPSLPGVLPTHGSAFAVLSTAQGDPLIPGSAGGPRTATSIFQTFVLSTSGPVILAFDYLFMTNEINTAFQFNDAFEALLVPSVGLPIRIVLAQRNDLQPNGSGELEPLAIPGVGGYAAGTPWLTGAVDVSAFVGQTVTLRFTVWDVGDNAGNSAVAIDNVRFDGVSEVIPEPSGLALAGLGAAGLMLARRRIKRKARLPNFSRDL
jgi:hypothetical protein